MTSERETWLNLEIAPDMPIEAIKSCTNIELSSHHNRIS